MRRHFTIAVAALAVGALSGVAAYDHAGSRAAGWQEIAWPFPRDGWPAGRAFRCDVGLCGETVELYVRPKVGFCNCDSGVADDDEVDRVADIDLISARFVADRPGSVVQLADMSGRMRNYSLHMPDGSRHAALGLAVSRRCDLVVAAARGGSGARLQQLALDFLGKEDVRRWMIAALDGRSH